MTPWLKWVPASGLIAAGTTLIAGIVTFAAIEADVSERAAARLKSEGQGWAKLTIDGRDLAMTGTAPSPEARVIAAETADLVFGVRVVADHSTVLPLASPYVFGIERNGGGIRLTGAVTGEAARAELRSRLAAALPGVSIDDRTVAARGAGPGQAEFVAFAVDQAVRLADGTVSLEGSSYRIAGKPLDFATWQALEAQLAGGLPKGLTLAADELQTPAPPRWVSTLTSSDGKVVLEGFLPDAAARDRLLARLKPSFPAGITDLTHIAPGARDGTPAALDFAAAAIAGLSEGVVRIDPAGFSIAGMPRDWATWDGLEKTLKSGVPGGLPLVADGLAVPVPSPYRLGITARDGVVTIDGFVPETASHDRLIATSKRLFARVDDRLMVAPGAPAGFVDTVGLVLPHLARLNDLGFELSGTGIWLKGGAPTGALAAQIAARIRSLLPPGFGVAEAAIVELPPPAQVDRATCQSLLASVQSGDKILFETGRATLDEAGVRVLDALVVASLKCLSAHVTVEGHTDASGDEVANQALSEARAAAVVGYLVAAGIARDRLSAIGWGESRPIADNVTAEGRQQNRRIEFKVD